MIDKEVKDMEIGETGWVQLIKTSIVPRNNFATVNDTADVYNPPFSMGFDRTHALRVKRISAEYVEVVELGNPEVRPDIQPGLQVKIV